MLTLRLRRRYWVQPRKPVKYRKPDSPIIHYPLLFAICILLNFFRQIVVSYVISQIITPYSYVWLLISSWQYHKWRQKSEHLSQNLFGRNAYYWVLLSGYWLKLSAASYYSFSLILQITLLLKVAEAATELLQRKNARRPLRYWACLTLQQKWGHGLDRPTAIGGLGGLASGSTQTLPLTMIVPEGSSASVVPEEVSLF